MRAKWIRFFGEYKKRSTSEQQKTYEAYVEKGELIESRSVQIWLFESFNFQKDSRA